MATPKKTTKKATPTASKNPGTKAKSAPTKATKPKTTAKSAATKTTETVPNPTLKPHRSGLMGWAVAVLLAGVLAGTYISDFFWMEQFDEEASMLVIDDTTWMPVGGTPVTVVVLNDPNCGTPCDASANLNSLRASITPAMKVKEVDIKSAEGQTLIETFGVVSVPQFFFEKDIEELESEGPEGEEVYFLDNLPAGVLTQIEDLYMINGSQVGFKPGKFISEPDFADLDSEPSKGTGPVKVIEFTNYQCSFCKRFYDQNIALIDQLVAENKITYIVKDFPMFQRNDRFAHRAAKCVYEQGGNEAYWDLNDAIFETQSTWSQSADARTFMIDLASEQGYDVTACMESGSIESEIMADMSEGNRFGVTGTPTIFVGTQILPGAVGPNVLSSAVEAELAN